MTPKIKMPLENIYMGVFAFAFLSCSYPVNDYTEDLGSEYIFVSESNVNQLISGPGDTTFNGLIPRTVIAYRFDERNIIAKQKSNDDPFDRELSDKKISFWIIDKKDGEVYGPLNSLSYTQKRKELTVSLDLRL